MKVIDNPIGQPINITQTKSLNKNKKSETNSGGEHTTVFGRFHDFSGEIVVVLVSFWLLTLFDLEGGLN